MHNAKVGACHTGESMSAYWKQATGQPMLGARGENGLRAGWTG